MSKRKQKRSLHELFTVQGLCEMNENWTDLFSYLRPSFNIPSRKVLSNRLLDAEYYKVKAIVDDKIESAPCVGVQLDSWTNIRNESIINFIVTTPTPVFLKSVSSEEKRHTTIYITKIISEVLDEISAPKVFGLCTDNATNMTSAWAALQAMDRFKHISFYGCSAHCLNLLAGDILTLKSSQFILTQATRIVNISELNTFLMPFIVSMEENN